MLSKENFTKEHIENLRKTGKTDPAILERTIYAFGLLEAVLKTGMPFIFKGGTALLLLLDKPMRLSTDIDIYDDEILKVKNARRIKYIQQVDSVAFAYLSAAYKMLGDKYFVLE